MHSQDDVNLHILRMLDGTVSLDAAYIMRFYKTCVLLPVVKAQTVCHCSKFASC